MKDRMTGVIKLSPDTIKIIEQLETVEQKAKNKLILPKLLSENEEQPYMKLSQLKTWMRRTQKADKNSRFLLESLYVAFLADLNSHLPAESEEESEKKKISWASRLKFGLLLIAGTIYFGCEGFDGVTTLLGSFSIPSIAILAVGLSFSILSIIVFYAFDIMAISYNLGISIKSAPKIVDIYLKEVELSMSIRKKIDNNYLEAESKQKDLQNYLSIIALLRKRDKDLDRARNELKRRNNNPFLKGLKLLTASIIGIIFFSGGFFAGQTVAMAIAILFIPTVASTFWPIVVAAILVGLASFAVYWFVERPGIDNLIGRILGLDKEKIDQFSDETNVASEKKELDRLERRVGRANEWLKRAEAIQIKEQSPAEMSLSPTNTTDQLLLLDENDIEETGYPISPYYEDNRSISEKKAEVIYIPSSPRGEPLQQPSYQSISERGFFSKPQPAADKDIWRSSYSSSQIQQGISS